MGTRRYLRGVIGLLALVGCAPSNDPFSLIRVEPNVVLAGSETPITVIGTGFYTQLWVTLDNDDSPVVQRQFQVSVATLDVDLRNVAVLSPTEIATLAPADLPVGVHPVTVTTPTGQTRLLADALRVVDGAIELAIEDAPGGQGQPVSAVVSSIGENVSLYAVARTEDGEFIADESVDWSLSGGMVELDQARGSQVEVTALFPGVAQVGATHGTYDPPAPVAITVLEAQSMCEIETIGSGNCADGVDNDCDALRDGEDPGCNASNRPPVAEFLVTPSAGPAMTEFVFDASPSFDPDLADDPLLEYFWHFDGDLVADAVGRTATKDDYLQAGFQTVILEVRDPSGLRDFFSGMVFVTEPGTAHLVVRDGGDALVPPQLTLRLAIELARAMSSAVITFAEPFDITLLRGPLERVGDNGPVHIIGRPGVVIDCGVSGASPCLELVDGSSAIWLEVTNSPDAAIRTRGTGNRVANCTIRDNSVSLVIDGDMAIVGPDNRILLNDSAGISMLGNGGLVIGNEIRDNDDGVVLRNGVGDTTVQGNFIDQNDANGVVLRQNVNNARIWHNTIRSSQDSGIVVSATSTGVDIRNNILADNDDAGIEASGSLAALDHNSYFGNDAPCSGCTPGPNSLIGDPPRFFSPGTEPVDLRIQPTSLCRDAGVDLGVDRNGGGPSNGLFNGQAPDIGAWEVP